MASVSPTSSTGSTGSTTGSTTPAGISSSQSSSSVDRSGLSLDDVVDAKLAPYLNQIDSISTTITSNQTKVTSYQDMQQLLVNLENSLDALRDPIDSTTDVFNMRAASLTSSDASITASNVMSVTVDPGTDEGSHTVQVTKLAQVERLSSGTQNSRTAALGETGTFTIGESGKTSASINITAGMSLNDVVSAINAQQSTTGVTANIVAVTGSTYKLVLTGADTNQTINMSTTSGTVLSDLGLTQADGTTAANVLQQQQPAELTVDGVAIQRDTNDIDDAIDGVTMNLTALTAGATVTVNIGNDTTSVSNAIQTFATSYNAWRQFVSQNQATNSDGTASSSATLFGDSTLRQVSTEIDSALTSLVGSTSLGAIGITVNANNELDIDTSTLTTALQTNFSSVQQLFSYTASTSDSDLRLTGHGDSTLSGSFTVNVTTDANGNLTGATATDSNGNTTALQVSGRLIEGASGTAYDGLVFAYSGDQSENITVNASQGIADQMYQVSKQAGDPNLGSVQSLITDLQNTDNTLTSNMNDLQSEANNYYNYLLNYYGTLESSISEANQTSTLLQQMMALDATNNG